MKKHSSHLATVVFSLLLVVFTVYISLDTFVLASAYQQDATAMNMTLFEQPSGASPEPVVTETSYQDENITIVLSEYETQDTTVMWRM